MISAKQKIILAFPYSKYDALICDGAVRSGKTSIMMWSFVRWAMESFNGQRFGVCGRTVDSCTKNIIVPFTAMGLAKEKYMIRWRRGDKVMEVRRGAVTNYFEVFGGKDEASYTLIQGRTLAGVLLDEVVLMPRSFVEQALTRCSVDGAKLWFSCNPGSPQHWFYTEWIQRHEARNTLYLHFEMTDNPGLSQKTLERYQAMFSGVFYDRYIRGLWVLAEGLIYPMFGEGCLVDNPPQGGRYYISCDYGTLNPFSAGLWCWDGKTATRVAEYYYSGRQEQRHKTDEDYYTALEQLAGDKPVQAVIVDPSAASFIEVIRRHKRFPVRKAKNDVLAGINTTARFLQDGTIKIHRSCSACIREFGLYRWDEKAETDRPVKENDHAMDDIRYFAYTVLRQKAGKTAYQSLLQER
nr:MAG TPA: large terminase [Caudoviricetes sp.]DAV11925.1 MAG TPA: large terminase [Caudoviricetes sp.]